MSRIAIPPVRYHCIQDGCAWYWLDDFVLWLPGMDHQDGVRRTMLAHAAMLEGVIRAHLREAHPELDLEKILKDHAESQVKPVDTPPSRG